MRTSSVLAFLVPVLASGCSAGENAASSTSDVVIHPVGPGGDITLTLTVPPETMTSSEGGAPSFYIDGPSQTPLVVNQPTRARYEPDANGLVHIVMTVRSPNGSLSVNTPVKITETETTFALGGVQITRAVPAFNPSYEVDVDHFQLAENLVRHNPVTNQDEMSWWGSNSIADEDVAGPVLPAFPGHYTWTSNLLAQPLGFDVVAGTVAKVDGNGSVPMGSVVVQEDAKTFPDVAPAGITVWCTDRTSTQSAAQQTSFGQTLAVYTVSTASCTWGVSGFAGTFTLDPKQNVVIPAKRLEIDDVELSDEPGTKVPGRYSVSANGQPPNLTNRPTKTGVSLPAGQYHVHIDYNSPQGSPRTLDQDVTL